MNVGLVGNNDGPLRLLRAMRAAGREPVCVGLQKPPDEAAQRAYAHAAPNALFTGFEDAELVSHLQPHDLDLLVNAFCNFRFQALLNQSYDVLNVHLAPLPRYRGRHPLQWALINGESQFGASIHRMTPDWDAGSILWQTSVAVDPGMSVAALRSRLLNAVAGDFGEFLHRYEAGTVSPLPNRDADASYVARRVPSDSALTDWRDHTAVIRKVMALRSESYPAYLTIDGTRIAARAACAASRYYVGLRDPFVCRAQPDALEIACLDGHTVRLSALTPAAPDVSLNARIQQGPYGT